MTKKKKVLLWIGLVISVPAAGYSALSVIFYSWLEASQQWPTEKAAIWAGSAAVLTILFTVLFIYCLVLIIKESKTKAE